MAYEINSHRLTLYFSIIAVMIAGMIGLGHGSWNLPLLVLFCSILGAFFTDRFEWIVFPKWFVYLGMLAGAGVAIMGFLGDPASNQILAVGNLLVYVQLPLLFQRKSKRVFEQWGVFLLLELVVAALVNDNVLFGILMVPVMTVGCAALIALALYASQMRHLESLTESNSVWARILHWLGKEQLVSKRSSGVSLSAVTTSSWNVRQRSENFSPLNWFVGVLPLSFTILLFAIVYFYSLPRVNLSTYEGAVSTASKVGFSDQISLQHVGDLLQNEAPVFRLSMRNAETKENYRPSMPPYIRMTVSRRYFDGPGRGVWQTGEASLTLDRRAIQNLPMEQGMADAMAKNMDRVMVDIVEKNGLGTFVPVIAPLSRASDTDFQVAYRDWFVVDTSQSARSSSYKRRFSFPTYAFEDRIESMFLPEWEDSVRDVRERSFPGQVEYNDDAYMQLLEFPSSLMSIVPLRDRWLKERDVSNEDKLTQAMVLNDYLASGADYTYTLSLTGQIDKRLDPIADFLLNKRKGHCQYFASSLALLLRSLEIPTRMVVGFRPNEYNEVGKYFLVQQNHAHVWVEAYFPVDLLKKRFPYVPGWIKNGAWLRLDPTPAGEGSNAGGMLRSSSGQTFDAMQDLWNELVLNMDKSKQSKMFSIFGESSSGTYSSFWLELQTLFQRMKSNRFVGGFLSPEQWFSWQFLALFFALVLLWLFAPRIVSWLFPRWSFRGAQGARNARPLSKVHFYERLIKALRRLGIERKTDQTPQEFFELAASKLNRLPVSIDSQMLSHLYYELRYGGRKALTDSEQLLIEQQLQSLESVKGRPV